MSQITFTPNTQSVVCLVPTTAELFDIDKLIAGFAVGKELGLVRQQQVAVAQYENLQIFVAPGRVQLDVRHGASDALIREATARLLDMVRELHPSGVGFNAVFKVEAESPLDPAINVVKSEVAAEILGVNAVRGGYRLMSADDDGSVWTWALDPIAEDQGAWMAALNRNYAPVLSSEAAPTTVDWFVTIMESAPQTFRRLAGMTDD